MNLPQPLLTDEWGCPFYGKAETDTGAVWTYIDVNGVVHPLLPEQPIAAAQ